MIAATLLEPSWLEDPQEALERHYIEDFLESKGVTLRGLKRLSPKKARLLMREACMFASLKLAERDARARLVRDIHG